jgi:tagatose 1,6-diphosphate aldolase
VARELTIGKLRGLRECSGRGNTLSMLALDHRNNLRKELRPEAPGEVSDAELTAFKREAVAELAGAATAVLLDPELGAAQCIASGAMPGDRGLVVALERTGYGGEAHARESRLLNGWSAAKVRRMGASAAKLLVYYHPAATTAARIEQLVHDVAADCAREDLLLLLEPLVYDPNPNPNPDPGGGALAPDARRRAIVEAARRLTGSGVDVLKAEFPAGKDEGEWLAACEELTAACPIPWILLSAKVDFETFLRQTEACCRAGASGVAVGRAVWSEATRLEGEERTAFLRGPAARRMREATAICAERGRPWSAVYGAPSPDGSWFSGY